MSYRDNIAWKKSVDVYKFTDCLPGSEKFGLISPIQRSAVAIPSNVAEGYGRTTKLDYARFVNIALGSTRELQTQLEICQRLDMGDTRDLVDRAEEIAKILYGVSKSLRSK